MSCGDMVKGHPGPITQAHIDSGRVAALEREMNVGAIIDIDMPVKAAHFSEGKSGVDQLPIEVLLEWGQVYTMGEKKYGRDNWKGGTEWHEFYGSAFRHMLKFWSGKDMDEESGISHLTHAIWNLAAIRYYQLHGLGKDTRDVLDIEPVIEIDPHSSCSANDVCEEPHG